METVTISKTKYRRLKKLEKIDFDLIRQLNGSLDDLKKRKFKILAWLFPAPLF
ncbi:MAG TPA: hypothetical protein VJK05_01025 [archaeon]|nr:hypothetical protein [archaeon]